tara:strand:+ start:252 stop:461 length:210 start_codon:yes stop_codon:yes gene_type:complete
LVLVVIVETMTLLLAFQVVLLMLLFHQQLDLKVGVVVDILVDQVQLVKMVDQQEVETIQQDRHKELKIE